MHFLAKISDGLERFVSFIGRAAGWVIFLLIGVTIFDVVTRRFLVLGSTKLQELEWHFHVILFICCLGFALFRDAHVRIEILRSKFDTRQQHWVEFLGTLILLLPFCGLVIYFGTLYTIDSFVDNETSASATGLGYRWLIKMFLPFGFLLLALGGIATIFKSAIKLFGAAR
jgi:TRAP-type mannitol/chloroaromatic compound transport system permease small subunit